MANIHSLHRNPVSLNMVLTPSSVTFPLNSSRLCICCAIKTGSNGSVVRSGQDSLSFASYMLRKLVVCPSFHGGAVMASRRRKILIFKVRIRVEMVIRGRFGRPDFGGHRASCWHFEDYSSFWIVRSSSFSFDYFTMRMTFIPFFLI